MQDVLSRAIRTLRERKHLTQKQLADLIHVSDKAVSKWETERGMPDLNIIRELAAALDVSVSELLSCEICCNENREADLQRMIICVCPNCGNTIVSIGDSWFSCCGVPLHALKSAPEDEAHTFEIKQNGREMLVCLEHPMEEEHAISFFLYVTDDRYELIKLRAGRPAVAHLNLQGPGTLYAYCSKHGLFARTIDL